MAYIPPTDHFRRGSQIAQTPVRQRFFAACWTERTAPLTLHAGEVAEGEPMDETEWLACNDPQKMLKFMENLTSDRKLRLFGCACVRRVWRLLKDERTKEMVLVAERHA